MDDWPPYRGSPFAYVYFFPNVTAIYVTILVFHVLAALESLLVMIYFSIIHWS